MRRNDRNAGWIKALIILALIIANIVVALPRHSENASSRKTAVEDSRVSPRAHTAVPLEEPSQP